MHLTGSVVFWRDDKGFGFVIAEPNKDKFFFHIRDLKLQDNALTLEQKLAAPSVMSVTSKDYRPSVGDQLQFSLSTDKNGRCIAAPWRPSVECLTQHSLIKHSLTQHSANGITNASANNASQPTRHNKSFINKSVANKSTNTKSTNHNIDIQQTKDIALFFRLGLLVLFIIAVLFGTLPYLLPILYLEASLFSFWLYRADKQAAIRRQRDRLSEQSLQLFSLIGGWPGAYYAQKKLKHKNSKWLFQREFGLIILANSLLVIWLISSSGQAFFSQFAFFAG